MKSAKQRKEEIKAMRAKREKKKHDRLSKRIRQELSPGQALCNPRNLAPYNSYGEPTFVQRGFYQDIEFQCRDCCVKEVWRATQQKWWYEVAKGNVDTTAIRCRPCRKKQRERKAEARRSHLEGVARNKGGVPNKEL